MKRQRQKSRLCSLTVNGIKNIHHGTLEFLSEKQIMQDPQTALKPCVFGLYGPNGSGKSAILDGARILQKLTETPALDCMTGALTNADLDQVMSASLPECSIEMLLFVESEKPMFIRYRAHIARNDHSYFLSGEEMSARKQEEVGNWQSWSRLFEYDFPKNHLTVKGMDLSEDREVWRHLKHLQTSDPLYSAACSSPMEEIWQKASADDVREAFRILRAFLEQDFLVLHTEDTDALFHYVLKRLVLDRENRLFEKNCGI